MRKRKLLPAKHLIAIKVRVGLLVLVLGSVLLSGGILVYLSYQTQMQQLENLQYHRSHAIAVEINTYIEDLHRKLGYLARVKGLSDMSSEVQNNLLEGLSRHNSAYELIAIADSDGNITTAYSPYNDVTIDNIADMPLFKHTFKWGEDYFGDVHIDVDSNDSIVTFGVPIRNSDDEVAGVLMANVNLHFLFYVISQAELGGSGYAYVIDNRNYVIAQLPGLAGEYQFTDLSDRLYIKGMKAGRIGGLMQYNGLKEEPVIGSISTIPKIFWSVIVEMPVNEALAPIWQLLRVMGLSLAIALTIVIFTSIIAIRGLTVPLGNLTKAASELSKGRMDTHVDIVREDELGILAATFNKMTGRLRKLISNLQKEINERRKAEKALKESKSRYRGLFEYSPISLWEEDFSKGKKYLDELRSSGVTDFKAYFKEHPEAVQKLSQMVKILNVNKGTLEMFNANNKKELFSGLSKVFTTKSYDVFQEELITLAENGKTFRGEAIQRTLDGKEKNVILHLNVIPGYEESLGKILVSLLDITDRKKAEQKLNKAHDELEEKVRRRTAQLQRANNELKDLDVKKDQFITIAAHELKTPLTSIRGFAQLMKKTNVLNDKKKTVAYLDTIDKNAATLYTLILDLIDSTRISLGKIKVDIQKVPLKPIFDDIKESMEVVIKDKGLKPAFSMEKDLKVKGDPDRIMQVIRNLLANAVNYTDKGSISLKIYRKGKFIQFEVKDTGTGIPKERHKTIFERFYQVGDEYKKAIKGSGLGLFICKGLVKVMKGKIWVKSDPGKGSTFYFTVPATK